MDQKEKQLKNSITYFIPSIVSTLVPFLTLPIFTRILTKEDYGALALAQVYAVVFTGIANFGLSIGYERNFFEYKDSRSAGKLFYSAIAFVISIFILLAIFTFAFRSFLAKLIIGTAYHSDLIIITYCATFFLSYKIYFLTYFKNTENAKFYVSFTVAETILTVALSLIFVVSIKLGVIGLVLGQLISSFTVTIILLIIFLRILPFSLDWSILKNLLTLSYPLTPRIFFNVLGNQFDKLLIGMLNTTGGVGIYSIGQKVSYVVFTSMTALQNVYSPQVYKRMFEYKENGGAAIGKYLTPYAYISIMFAFVVAIFAQEIMTLLLPKSFHGAIFITMILTMLYGSYFFGKQPQLIFAKKTFITSLLTLLHIGLNIGINIPFILKWGAIGAAWATFLAGLISTTATFAISQHYYRIKWEYLHLVHIFSIFYGFTIMIILLLHFGINYYILLIIKVIALSFYYHAGVKCGVINMQNLMLVKKIITRSP